MHQYLEKMLPEITYNIGAQHKVLFNMTQQSVLFNMTQQSVLFNMTQPKGIITKTNISLHTFKAKHNNSPKHQPLHQKLNLVNYTTYVLFFISTFCDY